jgi:chemotaxis protein CheD
VTQLVVGVADCMVSRDAESVLVTYALGSCIGLAVHDGANSVGGLLHFMLPTASINEQKGRQNPWMFADTGVPRLLERVMELGAVKRYLSVRAIGGAQVLDPQGVFAIGKRNYIELKKVLWKAGLMLDGEVVGGTASRTVRLEVGSGRLWIRESSGAERELPSRKARPATAAGPGKEPEPQAAGLGKGRAEWRSGF